ncbi:MAG: hypothetical protein L0Z50_18685 [Verrucomicrobiales bacterium]|nr:hypothetical protein [Verrucomicrobiales bacterium]
MQKVTGASNEAVSNIDDLSRAFAELQRNFGSFLVQGAGPFTTFLKESVEGINKLNKAGVGFGTLFVSSALQGPLMTALRAYQAAQVLPDTPTDPTAAELERIFQEKESAQKLADKLILQTQGAAANTRTSPPGLKGDLEDVASKAGQARREAQAAAAEIEATIRKLATLEQESMDNLLFLNQQLLDANLRRIQITAAADEKRLRDQAEAQKNVEEAQLRARLGIKSTGQIIEEITVKAAAEFSAGFSDAFLDFASGAKDAGEAFKEFGANFLRTLADMILQAIIFQAVMAGLRALGAVGGGGFTAARGGLFPSMGGAKRMAAGGVEGAMPLNGPTFFPKFNVLAGEAGFEVGAFLARPQFREFGGVDAIVGDAGPHRLALANADQFAAAVRGGAGGRVEIHVFMEPGLRAEVVSDASNVAVSKVTQGLQQDSQISRSVKRLAT